MAKISSTRCDNDTGGLGFDVFRYLSVLDSGTTPALRDQITDFTLGIDKIDLDAVDADGTSAGNQAFDFIGSAGFSGVAGQLRTVAFASSTMVYGDINGDSTADFMVGLTGSLTLTSDSFIL